MADPKDTQGVQTGPTSPQRPEDAAGAASAAEANRVANEVESRQGPTGSPAGRAETPAGVPAVPTGYAQHPPHNQLSRPGNWRTDVATKIRESRKGLGPSGGFHEVRVRKIAPGELIPDHAEAVPDDMPEHDWLAVE